jgi:hypothetical protein
MPRVPGYTQDPIYTRFDHASSNRGRIDRINAQIDAIAADHGYAIPPASSKHPGAQEVRDRIAVLRRAIPDLSNRENTRLDRMDLKLDDMQQPRLRMSGGVSSTMWDGVRAGFDDADGGVTRLGALLREQQSRFSVDDLANDN